MNEISNRDDSLCGSLEIREALTGNIICEGVRQPSQEDTSHSGSTLSLQAHMQCLITKLKNRLDCMSCTTAAHRLLLSQQIHEWDMLLLDLVTCNEDLSSVGCLTCSDLLSALEENSMFFIFANIALFLDVFEIQSSYHIRQQARAQYASVCTSFKRCFEKLVRGRRSLQRSFAIQQYPTFLPSDFRKARFQPEPEWRAFKIQIWWYFHNDRVYGTGWYLSSEEWVSKLAEVNGIWSRSYRTAGLYSYVQILITMWTLDLHEQSWEEENHI